MSKNRLTKLYGEWLPYLSWFDEQLKPILAELLSQLNLFLGPVKENHSLNNDWHTGLGEIKSRGHYENLLLSEWLLFDDEPNEFLRRVVNNEHLFLAPMPEEEKSNQAIIALFDEGILQLGHLRVVHLIMMLLLDKRAKKQNSQFYWGTLQNRAELRLFEGLDSLLMLLNSKSLSSITNQHIDYWERYLSDNESDERWFIGADITRAMIKQDKLITHNVYINRFIEESDKLKVTISAQNRARTAILSLPNEIICTKILLGQLTPHSNYGEIKHQILVPIASDFPPCIAMTGNHIGALSREGNHVLFCSLEEQLSNKQKCKVTFQPVSGKLLALDYQYRKIIGLVEKDKKFYIWLPNRPLKPLTMNYDDFDKNSHLYLTRFMWIYTNHGQNIYLIDKQHNLWRYDINKQLQKEAYEPIEVDKNVLTLHKHNSQTLVYVKFYDNDQLWLKSPQLNSVNCCLDESRNSVEQIYMVSDSHLLICVLGMKSQWTIAKYHRETRELLKQFINIPEEWQVFGLFFKNDQLLFLVIHQDRKRVATYNPDNLNIEELYYSSVNIIQFSFSALANTFALITEDARKENSELILYSLSTDSVRVVITTKEALC